jgi:hypothetical protein
MRCLATFSCDLARAVSRACPGHLGIASRASGLPPAQRLGWASMRAMFVIYLVGITAGLVYFTTIGLLHH